MLSDYAILNKYTTPSISNYTATCSTMLSLLLRICILNLLFFILLQVFHEDFVLIHVLLTPVIFFAPFRPSQSTQFTQSSQFTQFVQSSQFIQLLQSLHPLQSLQSLQPSQLLQSWHPHKFFAAEQLAQSLQS